MSKRKKDKNASAAAKIARKTLGLVVRVGDALEAAVAAASPAPTAASTPTPLAHATSAAGPASPSSPSPEAHAIEKEPATRGQVAVAAVSQAVSDGARAIAAIEAYATLHNLEAIDMPSRGTLVDALLGGMAEHGSKFTDGHVLSLIDEQMRVHFRALATRTVVLAPASPDPERVA
jgi:hypothetical protein